MKKTFSEISKEIIDISQDYQNVNPEILNLFEHTFKVFLHIVKNSKDYQNKYEIFEVTMKELFGTMQKPKQFSKTNKTNKTNYSGDFNPNDQISGVDLTLLNRVKEKLNNVRESQNKTCKTSINNKQNGIDFLDKEEENIKKFAQNLKDKMLK